MAAAGSPSVGGPYIPDGTWNYGMYDAVNYSTNRAARPFFAVDSKFTLTSWSRLRALALARWAYINVPVVKGAVDLAARLAIGTGFAPKTHCRDTGLGKAADEYYAAKADHIGFMRGESMDELLMYDCRGMDVDGDLGYVMTQDETGEPKLQLIEGHRIKNGGVDDPRCIDGCWVDQYGRVQGWNIELPGEDGNTRRIDAQNFIYLAEHNRPDEVRSMTNLIHALEPLQDLYEILSFATTSAKKNSEIAALIQTTTPNDPPGLGPMLSVAMRPSTPAQGGQPASPQQMITREQIYGGGGKIPILRPGEEFKSYAHGQPSPTIREWAEFIIRGIAVGKGMPFEVLWSPESIGGANTRMILGLLGFRLAEIRKTLRERKLRRVRFWILAKGIKSGDLKYSPDLLKCSWTPKFSDLTVDAGRESKERRANVIAGLDTWTGYYSDNGEQYDEQVLVRQAEIALQCESARALCAQYPELSFEMALARIALLSQNASEVGNALASGSEPEPSPASLKPKP